MHDYEIRILSPDGFSAIITCEIHLCDSSAIRAAYAMADGLQFEVWRGMDRIYGPESSGAPVTSVATSGYRH